MKQSLRAHKPSKFDQPISVDTLPFIRKFMSRKERAQFHKREVRA